MVNGIHIDSMLRALKATVRTGWMLRGVPPAVGETIASHMSEASILALILAEKLRAEGVDVDPFRAASIAAVHDVAEAVIGDIVKKAVDIIGRDVKEKAELQALKDLDIGLLIPKLVEEYVEQSTREAMIAKVAETLSTLLQSIRYVEAGYNAVNEILCSMLRSLERMTETCKAAEHALRIARSVEPNIIGRCE